MLNNSFETADINKKGALPRVLRNALLFFSLAIVWILIDRLAKLYFDSGVYQIGEVITQPILGIFRFMLIHNTGAAWGILSNSTIALAILSIVVCVFIMVFAFFIEPNLNIGCIIGLSLVFAGGVGNAVDRLLYGYVVDFIDFAFIDFPVFNIADIGVTCGVVIFLISFIVYMKSSPNDDKR